MTPKEKAKDIFSKYMPDLVNELGLTDETYELNKKFALIAIEEIIKGFWFTHKNEEEYRYWLDVKSEIEKL